MFNEYNMNQWNYLQWNQTWFDKCHHYRGKLYIDVNHCWCHLECWYKSCLCLVILLLWLSLKNKAYCYCQGFGPFIVTHKEYRIDKCFSLPIQQTPNPSAHVPSEDPPMLSHSPLQPRKNEWIQTKLEYRESKVDIHFS